MFFQKEIETMKRSELEALQLERLKWTVDYCYKNVPFYTKKLDEAGISADKIKSLSDIKYIPPTTKADLRDNYPFGLFARPMKEMVRIHASSGTTGKPTVVGYTKHDLDLWSDCVARLAAAAGRRRYRSDIFRLRHVHRCSGSSLRTRKARRNGRSQFER